jgi:hypothetical protein
VTSGPGRPAIRIAGPGDAPGLLRLKQRLDQETAFMLLEPGERDTSVQAVADELGAMARSEHSAVILAESGDELVGYLERPGRGHEAACGGQVLGPCLVVDGRFVDELYMALILDGPCTAQVPG